MTETKRGLVAVIFISQRNGRNEHDYAAAAMAMAEAASLQPGCAGIDSVCDESGYGIAITYWQDEAAAAAWRGYAEHGAIHDRGLAEWYEYYEAIEAVVTREHRWPANN